MVSTAQMGRYKWLFLLCLSMVLTFVSFYLRKSPADVNSASHWPLRMVYDNLPRYKVGHFKGVLDTIDRQDPTRAPEEATRTSKTSGDDSRAKTSTPAPKELVKADVQRTTKQPQTVKITEIATSPSPNENQTVSDLSSNKTDPNVSLAVDTGKNRTEATRKPAESGTPPPPTVPPAKRDPQWFLSDDTYTKSKCPSAIRKNPEKVPDIVKFIPDIPVLMWNEHISPEEYARLKRFHMCYGWKGISYQDVKNCLRHLNTSVHRYMFPGWTPDHAGCIRCAVVGNGGILRGSGKGKEIDGHDFVWRVNAAITEGFEEDVGTRTSFYFHDVNTMKNSQWAAQKYGYVGPPQDKETVYTNMISAPDMRDYFYLDAAISWKPVTRPGRDRSNTWLNSSHKHLDIYRPTTGAAMLLTALHTCDVTDAYGFITEDHKQYSDHYYETDWHKVAQVVVVLRMRVTPVSLTPDLQLQQEDVAVDGLVRQQTDRY
ncbi:ST6GALNAC2 [Branchiostoma lanceolatum]|uniref:alpha-N-acetylgalactosaminide alpha-2,6-sialyltransferase n=1 Tax=Branchiostoma lanceolatum TaxID=7740 RepID=A0A8J9W2G0_BRALA|nr:ST6GALNAC2 [Branchiostoma lanceolatum]